MDNQSRIELLEDAFESLEEAISMIDTATRGSAVADKARMYIVPHLQSWLGTTQIGSIPDLIAELEDNAFDEDPDAEFEDDVL